MGGSRARGTHRPDSDWDLAASPPPSPRRAGTP
ncbi:nucleotidyltransferase domain-containing protein [Streptomyces sp. NPDC052503]